MKRTKIVAGNWKMNTSFEEGIALVKNLREAYNLISPKMIIMPPFTYLTEIKNIVDGTVISVGAQNCHQELKGAYTGEISPSMLKSCDIPFVILGHSERRQYCGETDILLAKKVNAALSQGLTPIFCVGEPLDVRNKGEQNDFVLNQFINGLFHLSANDFEKLIIAYEPIWAIGTGLTASPEQAQGMHAFIRQEIKNKYGEEVSASVSILYGGSVKGSNARDIFSKPDVDGALVGGASLDVVDFLKIANSF